MPYHELNVAERSMIDIGLPNSMSRCRLARMLDCSQSTISHEIRHYRTSPSDRSLASQ